MSDPDKKTQRNPKTAFPNAQNGSQSFILELWGFMRLHKKWWLIPIVLWLLIITVFIYLGGSGVAPFIYTLF